MNIPVSKWVKKNSDILFNTGSLIGTMLVTSVLGFAYWLVAARFYPPDSVGLASAATSAMMLLSTCFLLGQGTVLLTEIPRHRDLAGSLVSTSLLLVGVSTLVASIVFAVLAAHISPQLGPLGETPQNALLFAVGTCLAAMTVILDQAVIALLKGGIQLWRNTVFATIKLVLLVLAAQYLQQTTGMSIYTSWALGNAISLLPILIFLVSKKKWSLKYYIPQWHMMRNLGLTSIQHHMLNLILQAPPQVLPLIVSVMLSTKMNASFYTAYMIANFIFSLSLSLTTVLHATNAAQVTTLTQKTRMTVGLAFLSSLCAGAILLVGAGPILGIFGKLYANNAVPTLRILVFASIPLIIKNHFISLCRIKDRVGQIIVPIGLGSLFELVMAAFGAHTAGLTGLSLGWVSAMSLEALFMAPTVVTVLLGHNPSNPYLDEIATSDTIMLPALNQQTGAIQLVTLGDMMTVSEIDTVMLPVIQLHRSNTVGTGLAPVQAAHAFQQQSSLPTNQQNKYSGSAVQTGSAFSHQFRSEPAILSSSQAFTIRDYEASTTTPIEGGTKHMVKRPKPLLLRWLWPVIILLSIVTVIFFTFIDPGTPIQGIAILWFVTLCPGMSLVPLLKLEDTMIEIMLVISLSLSIDAIVVGIFLYSGHWSPPTTLWILITLSLVGSILQLVPYEKSRLC